eukprot:6201587-Pleurochrysis_carterae.AAC.1
MAAWNGSDKLIASLKSVVTHTLSVSSLSLPTRRLDRPTFIALGSGDALRTLARRSEHAESFISSYRASREGDSSGAPAMSMPEGVVIADNPSVSSLFLFPYSVARSAGLRRLWIRRPTHSCQKA